MWPILFKLGPFTLHTYGLLVAAGFFLGYFYSVRLGGRHGLNSQQVTDICWVSLLSGLIGARLLYVSFNYAYYLRSPLDILKIWQGGLVWYGGLIAALAAGLWWTKRHGVPFWLAADTLAPGLSLGHAVGRLGCFAAGCCYGKPTDLPWAVTFRHEQTLAVAETPLHPSQLYEAALDFFLFLVLASCARRPSQVGGGRVALLYVAVYALIRLAVEWARADNRGPLFLALTSTQWIAVASFVTVAVVWTIINRQSHV